MKYGCIGRKLGHSYSKELHSLIADYDYELKEIEPVELDYFMKEKNFLGINVTIPYKEDVIKYIDHISETARRIGSVNTIVNKDGKLYGYNTDYFGMIALINKAEISLKGKKLLILGTGGTSKTAECVARDMGAREIVLVSRFPKENAVKYDDAYKEHNDSQVIINTTPVGMYPNADEKPIDIERFPSLEGVIDVIYNPARTKLLCDATKKEIKSANGLYMLVAQAIFASEKFQGINYSDDVIDDVYDKVLKSKEELL